MTRNLRNSFTLSWKTLLTAAFVTILAVTLVQAQTYQTGIPPFATVGGGPDNINLADNSVHWSFPVFSRAGRGIPLSFELIRDTTGWTQGAVPGGTQWFPVFGDYIPANSVLTVLHNTPTCTDGYGNKHTYNTWLFTGFQDLQGNSHPVSISISYSNVPQPRGTCPGPQSSASGMAADGSGISLSLSLACAGNTGSTQGCPSITAALRDGSVMSWPGGGSPTWTDSNGNRITYNMSNGSLSSITDTLGTTALTYSSGSSSRSATYTSPYGTPATVTMLFQQYTVQTAFNCPGISDYPATSWSLPYQVNLPDGTYYAIGYETLSNGNTTGRIASVRIPTGATISYYYSGGTNGINCADGSVPTMTRKTPDGTWTYTRALTLNSSGIVEYSTNTIQDPQGNQTVMTFSGYNTGLEMQRQVYTGSATGTPIETIVTCYNGMTTVSSCPTAVLNSSAPSEITKYTSLNGGPYAETDTLINSYGLVTEKDEYDFGFTTPTRKTSISYANIGGGVQDRPSVVKTTDGAGNFISETDYTYDEDVNSLKSSGATQLFPPTCSSGTCRGNTTTVKTCVTQSGGNCSSYLTKTFTHYDTGQVYTSTDVNSAQTTFTYGACGNSLLTNVSEPLGLSKSFTWNCTGGVMTSATDENGKTSYTHYANDQDFWRPDNTQDALGFTTSFTYTGATQVESVLPVISGQSSVDVLNTVDSLGRPYLTQRRQAPSSANFDTGTQFYDTDGRVYKAAIPCVKTAGLPCSTTPSTTTTYDGTGRPLQVTDGGGGTLTMTYSQNDVLRTLGPAPAGEHTKSRQVQSDGLGRITSVCEVLSSGGTTCGQNTAASGYLTSYVYSTLTTGTGVTQTAVTQGAQTRTYVYDGMRRLISETNPESQITTYFYDSVAANYCANPRPMTT